ncbi:MAG: prephenate dehydratase domain-containing protein, partial [Propionibacteriaceae bacterium]|nr:prephenate dehydratase domain-containing protein [Propionibacteriaceae bacterium]
MSKTAAYGYLGPAGTFCHQALLSVPDLPGHLRPYPSVVAALDAVRNDDVAAALVPIENNIEGGVSATLDNLTYGRPLMITTEVLLPVEFNLYARPGTTLADVGSIVTHPHAAAQCRDWVNTNLPHATVHEGGSTAAGAAEIADPNSRFQATICSAAAGEMYQLDAVAHEIADNKEAVTRFILVTKPGPPPQRTGSDKTTLTVFLR